MRQGCAVVEKPWRQTGKLKGEAQPLLALETPYINLILGHAPTVLLPDARAVCPTLLPAPVWSETRHTPAKIDSVPATAPDLSERPRHPSLSRVKGRSNMYTPPRLTTEKSWLNDQSPTRGANKTPPRQPSTSSQEFSLYLHWMKLTLDCLGTPEPGTPTMVNPASSLLQDLLKEQRANRSSRGTIPECWEDGAPRTPEGPRIQEDTASEKARKVSDALSNGQRQPIGMGMREMDQVRLIQPSLEGYCIDVHSTSRK